MAVTLGEWLLREERITPLQLEEALNHQRRAGGRLGASLVTLGILSDDDVAAAVGRQMGIALVDLKETPIDPTVIDLVSRDGALRHAVLPVARSGTTLTVAMADPADVVALDQVKFMTGLHVEPVVAGEIAIREAALKVFGPASGRQGRDPVTRVREEREAPSHTARTDTPTTEREDGPVVQLVNAMMLSALRKGASDIHIEPGENELRVRFRIDGQLCPVPAPAFRHRDALISRLKIMARLDIAEKRLPQDGRIRADLVDRGRRRTIDFRVSVLPTIFGEKVVLRLLDPDALVDLAALGFETDALEPFERAIRQPWGMVLVSGPTGSGKTSTLYSSLARLNEPDVNIVTAEDPVEFNLRGVNQVQVRENIGLGFATVLRSFLRQDPNIILVGEIRDSETAAIAVRAALTGHLVLSTLHTTDAPGSLSRLVNMGVEPFLVASSLNLVCAQRLVRRICEACRERDALPAPALLEAGFSREDAGLVPLFRGRGCERCAGTGYKGRVGLFEVMEMSEPLRELAVAKASATDIRKQALRQGMTALRQRGLQKVRGGVTTLAEVLRETM
jgi:type IV pilus assembly protein PilB